MRILNEENISAIESQETGRSRLPEAHVHKGWTESPQPSAGPWPQAAGGLGGVKVDLACPSRMDSLQHTLRFPRRSRLKSPITIRSVTRDGRRLSGHGFTVHWAPVSDHLATRQVESGPRMAFVVSRRCGRAHQRNLIKRHLREAVRLNRAAWPQLQGGSDIVFRATGSEAARMDFQSLSRNVRDVLVRISGV